MVSDEEQVKTFAELGLDPRLSRALHDQSLTVPTLVQQHVIPVALDGKDLLVRARTGSGKTLSYVLPILQTVLKQKEKNQSKQVSDGVVLCLVLVPTKELCQQVNDVIVKCLSYIRNVRVSHTEDPLMLKMSYALANLPDILIATPYKCCEILKKKSVLSNLVTLVLDEADLLLTYGYESNVKEIVRHLPSFPIQSYILSATLTPDVQSLKQLVLHSPAVVQLHDDQDTESSNTGDPEVDVKHCIAMYDDDDDVFLYMFVILKLKLIPGKLILFANTTDKAYRIKLFLDAFSIQSAVLNHELPQNARHRLIEEFNKGVFDYLIATDSEEIEYSASRGVDFQAVAAILNIDFPDTLTQYVHRAGRTARGHQRHGMVLSFVHSLHRPACLSSVEEFLCHRPEKETGHAEITINTSDSSSTNAPLNLSTKPTSSSKQSLKKSKKSSADNHENASASRSSPMTLFSFDQQHTEGFRYRVQDVLRSVTRGAVKEARLIDLRRAVASSEKLKAHFEANPQEWQALMSSSADRRPLLSQQQRSHLKHIPDYLLPHTKSLRKENTARFTTGVHKKTLFQKKNAKGRPQGKQKKHILLDPLKSFRA